MWSRPWRWGPTRSLAGRPYSYALAVGAGPGVGRWLQALQAELDLTFALVGVRSPAEIDRCFVAPAPS